MMFQLLFPWVLDGVLNLKLFGFKKTRFLSSEKLKLIIGCFIRK